MGRDLELWHVYVEFRTSDIGVAQSWVDGLIDPRLEGVVRSGLRGEPEGYELDVTLPLRASDRDDAERLARAIVGSSPISVLNVRLAHDDETQEHRSPGPDDFQSTLKMASWHRSEPVGDHLRIVWCGGSNPLERVDVEEAGDRVTITLWERHPPAFEPDGTGNLEDLRLTVRCVDVPLGVPAADRPIYDGATGAQPAHITPGNYGERGYRSTALEVDLDSFPCTAAPLD